MKPEPEAGPGFPSLCLFLPKIPTLWVLPQSGPEEEGRGAEFDPVPLCFLLA